MKTEKEIRDMLNNLKSDERLGYPTANIAINAPLALIQLDLESRVDMLKWVLK